MGSQDHHHYQLYPNVDLFQENYPHDLIYRIDLYLHFVEPVLGELVVQVELLVLDY